MKAINLIAGATWLPFSSYFLSYSFFYVISVLFCGCFMAEKTFITGHAQVLNQGCSSNQGKIHGNL